MMSESAGTGHVQVAPKLAAAAKALERHMIADSVNQKLHERDTVDELEERNVIRASEVAPRLRCVPFCPCSCKTNLLFVVGYSRQLVVGFRSEFAPALR